MNTYKIKCQITFYKDVEVQANSSDEAYELLLAQRDNGSIVFTELDDAADGMYAEDPELISGEEPFKLTNLTSEQLERIRLHVAHYMPIENCTPQRVNEFMWKMLHLVDNQDDLNDLLTYDMILGEWIQTNLSDEL